MGIHVLLAASSAVCQVSPLNTTGNQGLGVQVFYENGTRNLCLPEILSVRWIGGGGRERERGRGWGGGGDQSWGGGSEGEGRVEGEGREP